MREHGLGRRHDSILAIDFGADGKSGPDGVIDQSKEIVFTQWAPGTSSDMAVLSQVFDTNHNGLLDGGDLSWSDFRIWQDGNGDGISQPGEVKTLASLGIKSIGLDPANPSQFRMVSSIPGRCELQHTGPPRGDVALAYQSQSSGAGSDLQQAFQFASAMSSLGISGR